MPIDGEGRTRGGASPSPGRDGFLEAALGVAEAIARRHGGSFQLRSSGDSVVVEFDLAPPAREA
jgi:hypothetical protein